VIHPAAVIDDGARLGERVQVGPWTWIGPDVEIGDDCVIGPHVVIQGPASIGPSNRIHAFCSIGDECQDKKFAGDRQGRLVIGAGNTLREYCSVNRGTPGGGGVTSIGDDNWIMAYCHIAHDCHVGSHTVFANNATLAGHVTIEDQVTLGGFTGVHQFCRLGAHSFTAIAAIVVKDVPPFLVVAGNTARAHGLNRVGLKRNGYEQGDVDALKKAYRILYRSGFTLAEALARLEELGSGNAHVRSFAEFVRGSERGIVR